MPEFTLLRPRQDSVAALRIVHDKKTFLTREEFMVLADNLRAMNAEARMEFMMAKDAKFAEYLEEDGVALMTLPDEEHVLVMMVDIDSVEILNNERLISIGTGYLLITEHVATGPTLMTIKKK